ncbi:MAG TPA: DMT family transporter [Candidatus Krumholzibacteriaceae bacterium]|jgi:drug/metabolite transporter (DMT)-like permease|nr:DMT family transporter [Candidatus Krumholzibacteriaceae bacterium]
MEKNYFYIFLASFGFSFIFIFSTVLNQGGISSLEQVIFRLTLALLFLFLILKGKVVLPQKRDLPYFIALGLVLSLFLLFALTAIAFHSPVPVTSALVYTQPIFTTIIAYLAGRERFHPVKVLVILIGVVGVFLVTNIFFQQITLGAIFALSAGLLYALYLFLKRAEKPYAPFQLLFNTLLFSVPCILGLGAVLTVLINKPEFVGFSMPTSYQFLLLFLFAFFSTILPYGSLNKVNPNKVSPSTEGTILLLDPTLHTFWAFLLLGQLVGLLQYVGIFLILLTAVLTLRIK